MKKPLHFAGLVVLVVAVLALGNGMQATASNPMRLDCGAGCGKTYHLSLTILVPEHSILGKPTMSAAFIDRVLATAHSPAARTGQTFYDAGVTSGIDPAWSLSFFHHESDYGTTGEARVSLSIGNMRCLGPSYEDLHPMCRDNFAWFPTWKDGIVAWYRMMLNGYVKGGITGSPCSTVERIIPTYAPSSSLSERTKQGSRQRLGQLTCHSFTARVGAREWKAITGRTASVMMRLVIVHMPSLTG